MPPPAPPTAGGFAIESPGARRHRRGTLRALLVLMGALATALVGAASLLANGAPTAEAIVALLVALVADLAAMALLGARGRFRAGTVEVRDGALRVPGGALALARLATAFVVPGNGLRPTRVEFRTRGGDGASVDLARPEQADPLLAAAGLGAEQRRLSMRLAGASGIAAFAFRHAAVGTFVALLATLFAAIATNPRDGQWPWRYFAVAALGYAAFALARGGPGRIDVGRDGVVIRRGPRREYVPFSRIAAVYLARSTPGRPASDVYIELDSTRIIALEATSLPEDERIGIATRIGSERIAALARPPSLEVLDRGDRPFAAWRDAMRQLGRARPGYRELAVAADELARVLHDAGSAAERRIAAAIALSSSGDAAARERVRVAAGACASPTLRVALERAADDALDGEALERAVREAEQTA